MSSSTPEDPRDSEIAVLKGKLERYVRGWEPGHFYSPVPDLADVERRAESLFGPSPAAIPAVDVNTTEQLRRLQRFAKYYPELPWKSVPSAPYRYHYDNGWFCWGEAAAYFCMLRDLCPAQVVEIGSGYSSAALLDVNEFFFDNQIACTFIDPFPDRLLGLLREEDRLRSAIIGSTVQSAPLSLFRNLKSGSFLFIDSSHVAKIGSDVNHIFFEILPALQSGVYIHFHDIFYPFEYPKDWVLQGRAWNEAYLLRAMLQYNRAFEIVFFNSYLWHFNRDDLAASTPLIARHAGSSIWLKKK